MGLYTGAQFNRKHQNSLSRGAVKPVCESCFLLSTFVLPQCNYSIHSLGHYELYHLIRLKDQAALFFMLKFIIAVIPWHWETVL